MLRGFSVADWPNMTKQNRSKLLKSAQDGASPKHLRPVKKYSNADLASLIAGAKKDV